MYVGSPLTQAGLAEQLTGLQHDLERLQSLIPEAIKFVQIPSEPVVIEQRKVFKFERSFYPCTVSPELKISLYPQTPLEVSSEIYEIDPKEIDEVKLNTVVVENTPLYKCTIILHNQDKIRFRSSHFERIDSLFKMLQHPAPCKVLNLRKSRVAYICGQKYNLGKALYPLLRNMYAIEFLWEPEGKIGKNHVLFYIKEGSPSREPQQVDLDCWIHEANKRSGGNGVYLLIEYGNNRMDSRRLPGSGIFMDDLQKRKPVVLRILREEERGPNDLEKLAGEVAELVDQVSGSGLEKESL